MNRSSLILPILAILVAVGFSSIFIVDEREKALVLQFGQVKAVKEEPGIGFKIPLIQEVVRYDGRILGLPTQPLEVTPLDDRRLVVDAFARWRIVDLVEFREAVGAGGIEAAQTRLQRIMSPAIREVLGGVPSIRVLSEDRTVLMNQIRDLARRQALALGVDVIDVRLTRTDLPEQNLSATYGRMRAEREREAADEIARGNEAAQRVRAAADRTVVEVTSEARRQAEVIRGEADAQRNSVYAEAFGRDPEFFAFTRSLTSYERALQGGGSSIVMQPDSEFFQYLRSDRAPEGTPRPAAPAAASPETGDATAPAGEQTGQAEETPAAPPAGQDAATPAPAVQ
ncbi:protease modulator HflC [Rhodobacter sphaeroides]|uniref:Protein HflC n=1 Tax=Cereibacter sphaeroides (strain ATCC 17023 / DSM 158 / JCM 6121 / CCUG 31486 / LMG 2827 / NBRC 12203 / NCIMB 8253 / ATH 2.4.1.) TaxID=272943 RepID=Q3J104_CERS4|nr:protease modulator HflC [Cereibacter sphaeroides]ABA79530.1 protease FtsH subunit HflC [Cereibacter sphaeroides 2.4.1]AMJ47821.1 protease [Cereibacter sphaeroides]ANS34530.1 protease modulator HflC [Cereibacter sphaeroides]ATN63578.1 protease modulator HflC [Cereibacter sphaeroides]AXC61744.1 protease modulator HflC [Cereibacter sphaeroides 2.4.1]